MPDFKSLILAVQFLTVIPVKSGSKTEEKNFPDAAVFFPVVGLFLGALLVLVNKLFEPFLPQLLLCIILVLLLVFLSGALHIDGLADTVDGFYAGKDRDSVLNIMRDSRIGTMGVVGIVSVVLLKVGFLSATGEKNGILLAMPVISRWTMTFSIFMFNYARKEGKAKYFFGGFSAVRFIAASLIAVAITYAVLGFNGMVLMVIAALTALIFGYYVKRKINGHTGDTLGALNEINEVLVLAAGYVFGGIL